MRSLPWLVKDEIDALVDTLNNSTLTEDKTIIMVSVAYLVTISVFVKIELWSEIGIMYY